MYGVYIEYNKPGLKQTQTREQDPSRQAATTWPKSLSLHWPQTASNPLTTSPHSLPASLSRSFRSQSPRSNHRDPSSKPSSSRRSSVTRSRAERKRRDAVEVNWRDSYSVSLRPCRECVRSEVWEMRVCSEERGFWVWVWVWVWVCEVDCDDGEGVLEREDPDPGCVVVVDVAVEDAWAW